MSTTANLKSATGSLTGSILMISGCCIGAGMIGLPAITALSGFLPSLIVLLFAWAFMISTGLLLLEVNLLFDKGTHLIGLTEATLGKKGRFFCIILFVFLFFSLLIAYLTGTGMLLNGFFSKLFNFNFPSYFGNVICGGLLMMTLMVGTHAIDWVNRIFIGGMVLTYVCLCYLGFEQISYENLARISYQKQLAFSMPVFIVSFGYQNLIPSITNYLGKNKAKIRLAIFIGCSIPFVIYVLWEMILLGMFTKENIIDLQLSRNSEFIIDFLRNRISSPHIFAFIQLFSFFALITSLLTVGLSFLDFLVEHAKSYTKNVNRLILSSIILIPPVLLSIYKPNLFLTGLNLAGGLGAVLLFGVIPVLMAWKVRAQQNKSTKPILPGGKVSLSILLAISIAIFSLELLQQVGVLKIATFKD